jgi:hypothetical protein
MGIRFEILTVRGKVTIVTNKRSFVFSRDQARTTSGEVFA